MTNSHSIPPRGRRTLRSACPFQTLRDSSLRSRRHRPNPEMAGDQGQAFVLEMRATLPDEATRSIRELRSAGDQADWKAVARSAHSLKSSAATLGFMRLVRGLQDPRTRHQRGRPGAGDPSRPVAEVRGASSRRPIPILEDLGRTRLR